MLLGTHEHTIDDKSRLTLPAKFRQAFLLKAHGQLQTLDGQHLPSAFPIHSQRYEHRPTANDPFFAHLLIASV